MSLKQVTKTETYLPSYVVESRMRKMQRNKACASSTLFNEQKRNITWRRQGSGILHHLGCGFHNGIPMKHSDYVIFWNCGIPMVFHWNPNIMNSVINIWWDYNGILPILPSLGLLSIHSMDDLTKTNMGCQPETKLGTILGNMGLYSNQILGF